jgi:hypothetical protein
MRRGSGDLRELRGSCRTLLAGGLATAPAQRHSSLPAERPVPAREMNEQPGGQASSQNHFASISAPSVPEAY